MSCSEPAVPAESGWRSGDEFRNGAVPAGTMFSTGEAQITIEEGRQGTHCSIRAGVVGSILAVAVAMTVAHGLGRPGGNLEESHWEESIQRTLQRKSGFEGVVIRTNGFDVTVAGWVASEADRQWIMRTVQDRLPAGRARLREELEMWTPAWLIVEKNGELVKMRGELPEGRGLEEILGNTPRPVSGDADPPGSGWVWFHRGVAAPAWSEGLNRVLGQFLAEVSDGRVEAEGDRVVLEGTFSRVARREEILAEARRTWGTGVRLVDRTTAPPLEDAELVVRRGAGVWDVHGVLPDFGAGKELNRRLGERFRAPPLRALPNVAEEAWMESAGEAIATFAKVLRGDGVLAVTPREVRLQGTVADDGVREEVMRMFARGDWGERTLVNELRLSPPGGQPFWLEVGRSGKSFQVRGVVAQESQREELIRILNGGGGEVWDRITVGGDGVSSPGWWPALVRLIDIFARESEEGSIQVAGETIQIAGRMKATGRREEFLRRAKALTGLPEFELRLAWPDDLPPRRPGGARLPGER